MDIITHPVFIATAIMLVIIFTGAYFQAKKNRKDLENKAVRMTPNLTQKKSADSVNRAWKISSYGMKLIGLLMFIPPIFLLKRTSFSNFYLVYGLVNVLIGVAYFVLSKKVKEQSSKALKIGIIIWIIVILDSIISLIITRNPLLLLSLLVKFALLLLLLTPLESIQDAIKKIQERK